MLPTPPPTTTISGGLRVAERVWYAFGDLKNRRFATAMNLAAAAVPVVILLHLAYYGLGVYRYKQGLLDDYLPTQITVNCANPNDDRSHAAPADVARFGGLPGARLAYRKAEIGVNLLVPGQKSLNVQAEGTLPASPDVTGARLVWGRPVGAGLAAEAVLPLALFERVGGALTDRGPVPDTVRLEVARTHDDVAQKDTTEVKVVGLLRSQTADKLFLPLELAVRFDQWCSGKIEGTPSNPGDVGFPDPTYDRVFAYVPKGEERRVTEDVAVYKASATRVEDAHELTVVRTDGDVWVALKQGDRAPAADLRKRLAESGFEYHSYAATALAVTVGGQARRVVALDPRDPRWLGASAKTAPAFGQLVPAAAVAFSPGRFVTLTAAANLPAGGDFYCTPDTLDWLAYRIDQSPAVGTYTRVQTNDLAAVAHLERMAPGGVTARQPLGWMWIDAVRGPQDRWSARDLTDWADRNVRAEWDVVYVGNAPGWVMQYRDEDTGLDDTWPVPGPRIRFIPKPVFDRLLGSAKPVAGSDAAIPCIRFIRADSNDDPPSRLGGKPLRVLKTVSGDVDELCIPDVDRKSICPGAKPAGLAVWGEWPRFSRVAVDLPRSQIPHRRRWVELPSGFSAVVQGDATSVARVLGPVEKACPFEEFTAVRAALTVDGKPYTGLCVLDKSLPDQTATAARSGGLALVDEATFRRLAFDADRAGGKLKPAGEPEFVVRVAPTRYDRLLDVCDELGLTAKPLSAVRTETWVKYEVKAKDGKFPGRMLGAMSQNSLTFPGLAPALTTRGVLGGKERVLDGAFAEDPRQFESRLAYGRWVGHAHGEAVLPVGLMKTLFPAAKPEEYVGREVDVTFHRDARAAALEPALTLAVTVVGVCDHDAVFLPHDMVHGVELWKQGKANYNNEKKTFKTPAQEYEQAGFVRATVFADDPAAVGPLVKRLTALGFKCEDNRHKQDGLQQLAMVLAGIVGVFYFFFALMGLMMVVLTTAMNIQAKRWEIGILKAHGVSRTEIVSIFSLQGMMLGFGAAVGGILAAMIAEPFWSWVIRTGFGLPRQALSGSLATSSPWWLFALTVALTVVVSLVGAAGPAVWFSRMKTVDALRPAG